MQPASADRSQEVDMTNARRSILLLLLAGLSLALTGCGNTIRGIGRDLENTGDAIEDAAS